MPIEIRITTDTADQAQAEMAVLLGRVLSNAVQNTVDRAGGEAAVTRKIVEAIVNGEAPESVASRIVEQAAGIQTDPAADNRSPVEMADEADKRAVGEASGGRKRRTKDEIAADEALTALATAKGVTAEKLFFAIGQAGRAVVEAELRKQPDAGQTTTAAISTGEERIGPEDDAATQEQDAADEAAEVEATRTAPATIDDVKAAVQLYVDKYGMKNTQEDGPKIFVEALGTPPAGEAFWKFSILPTDPEKLAHVVNVWTRVAAENPLKREAV